MKNIFLLLVFVSMLGCGSVEPINDPPAKNCSLCSSCGGEWFYWSGEIDSESVIERGDQCSGEFKKTNNTRTSLCCKDIAHKYYPRVAHYFGLNNFSDDCNNGLVLVEDSWPEVFDNSFILTGEYSVYNKYVELKDHYVSSSNERFSMDCIFYFPNEEKECGTGYVFSGRWILRPKTTVWAYGEYKIMQRKIDYSTPDLFKSVNLCCK